ncbi:DinB family protein [Brevibacillus massiliensis]|jgi:uncharacterized damage-inducible protein DinB|uniref:DinB family protein n=1 Tax=Brevibacillus massiliensis TaxID=1118054 RepID=UPI0002DDBC96|nr:DinB family protein [Brevibacillus massiliensis]
MSFAPLQPLWLKARERYLATLSDMQPEQLSWKVAPGSNSLGFLVRHIAEVEYRFASMFFARPVPESVTLATIGPVKDEGVYTDWPQLQLFMEQSFAHLLDAMQSLPDESWDVPVEAPIGVLTPREALGRLTYHMGYHAGQIGLIRKYGGEMR